MVTINLEHEKYKFTTKNVMNHFNIEELVVPTNDAVLKFYFKEGEPYLLMGDKEYAFESRGSMAFFLQKLSLNSKLMTTLSNETLMAVANESLQNYSSTLNLVIDKKTEQMLTVTSMSSDLVSWKKILQTVHDVFSPLEEKDMYVTTNTGLGISIVIANVNSELEVIRIEPQTSSSISIYRGPAREEVPLRGYDEGEIMETLREKLEIIMSLSPALVNG